LPGPPKEKPGGGLSHEDRSCCVGKPQKEEGDSAIPSSQRQTEMDRSHSPNGEEVVMDTSQVVVGTSQNSGEAVGCQPIRPRGEEEKEE